MDWHSAFPSVFVCHHLVSKKLKQRVGSLHIEQQALSLYATGKPGETAVAAHHTMARHNYSNGIGAHGIGHSPHCLWCTHTACHFGIRHPLTVGNALKLLPCPLLEFTAYKQQRQTEFAPLSGKILPQLSLGLGYHWAVALAHRGMQALSKTPTGAPWMLVVHPPAAAQSTTIRCQYHLAARHIHSLPNYLFHN